MQHQILQGHHDDVLCTSISHNGRIIASGGADHTIRMWYKDTGQLIHTLYGHEGPIRSVDFNRNGGMLASGGGTSDHTIRVWDVHTGTDDTYTVTLARTLQGHTQGIRAVKFSPDGAKIASAGNDGAVAIWCAKTGGKLLTYTPHGDQSHVICIAWSSDSEWVASGGADRHVNIVDAHSGMRIVNALHAHSDWVTCVLFSAKMTFLVSASHDTTIVIWDLDQKDRKLRLRHRLARHVDGVMSVCLVSEDTRVVSAGMDGSVRLWDVATGTHVRILSVCRSWVMDIAWSRDNEFMVTAGSDGSVRVWSLHDKVGLACLYTCMHAYIRTCIHTYRSSL